MITYVLTHPKEFKDPENRFLPNGDPVWSVSGYVKGTGKSKKKEDGTWDKTKDMGLTVSAFGTRFDNIMGKLKGDFIISVTGNMHVDPATGGPRIWTDKEGKPRASYELQAIDIVVQKWGDKAEKTEGKADGSNDEVPF